MKRRRSSNKKTDKNQYLRKDQRGMRSFVKPVDNFTSTSRGNSRTNSRNTSNSQTGSRRSTRNLNTSGYKKSQRSSYVHRNTRNNYFDSRRDSLGSIPNLGSLDLEVKNSLKNGGSRASGGSYRSSRRRLSIGGSGEIPTSIEPKKGSRVKRNREKKRTRGSSRRMSIDKQNGMKGIVLDQKKKKPSAKKETFQFNFDEYEKDFKIYEKLNKFILNSNSKKSVFKEHIKANKENFELLKERIKSDKWLGLDLKPLHEFFILCVTKGVSIKSVKWRMFSILSTFFMNYFGSPELELSHLQGFFKLLRELNKKENPLYLNPFIYRSWAKILTTKNYLYLHDEEFLKCLFLSLTELYANDLNYIKFNLIDQKNITINKKLIPTFSFSQMIGIFTKPFYMNVLLKCPKCSKQIATICRLTIELLSSIQKIKYNYLFLFSDPVTTLLLLNK